MRGWFFISLSFIFLEFMAFCWAFCLTKRTVWLSVSVSGHEDKSIITTNADNISLLGATRGKVSRWVDSLKDHFKLRNMNKQ